MVPQCKKLMYRIISFSVEFEGWTSTILHRIIWREKGRDLTQSYDKSPYTNRNVKRAKWQHKQRHNKVRLHSGCGNSYEMLM